MIYKREGFATWQRSNSKSEIYYAGYEDVTINIYIAKENFIGEKPPKKIIVTLVEI